MTTRPYLTPGQIEVLLLVEQRLTIPTIARRLHLSTSAIKARTRRIRAAFNCRWTEVAARHARQQGLLPDPIQEHR